MDTIFMNSITQSFKKKETVALSNLSIYYAWKI